MALADALPVLSDLDLASGASRRALGDGRWHFSHGPIDLIIGADGDPAQIHEALSSAWSRFTNILPELVSELAVLRRPVVTKGRAPVQGVVAHRMWLACLPWLPTFLTPMAAVAGAVADELITHFSRSGIRRAYINNGGDIALHLSAGSSYCVGLFSDLARYQGPGFALDGDFTIHDQMPIRGIATSGWRGRSHSLGIADSVTAFAATAAGADVAATMIANQVNADHPAIVRAPAASLKDGTDLGDRLVTVDVGPLPAGVLAQSLDSGATLASRAIADGLVCGAVLWLQGQARVLGLQAFNPMLPHGASTSAA